MASAQNRWTKNSKVVSSNPVREQYIAVLIFCITVVLMALCDCSTGDPYVTEYENIKIIGSYCIN